MKKIFLLIILSLCTSSIALAGHANGKAKGVNMKAGKGPIVNIAHPPVKAKAVGNVPPGVSKNGMPPGLTKQGKVPPGWSKGEKSGWDNDDGMVRRNWNRFLNLFGD